MSRNITYGARELLSEPTPLKTDCGLLCDRACCRADEDAGGDVWLFPDEAEGAYPWARVIQSRMPVTGIEVMAIRCEGACERAERPLCCRIFPLTPWYSKKRGEWDVRIDRRAWMVCPLCASGMRGLNPEFVNAARAAVSLLASDESGERFLHALAREEAAYRVKL